MTNTQGKFTSHSINASIRTKMIAVAVAATDNQVEGHECQYGYTYLMVKKNFNEMFRSGNGSIRSWSGHGQ